MNKLERAIATIAVIGVAVLWVFVWSDLTVKTQASPVVSYAGGAVIGVSVVLVLKRLWIRPPKPADRLTLEQFITQREDVMAAKRTFATKAVGTGYWKHNHELTESRIRRYVEEYGEAKTGPGYSIRKETSCYQCISQGVDAKWTHADIIKVAADNKIGISKVITIEIEKIIEVPVEVKVPAPYEVKVPFAETLSFGEHGSLTASLQHGQHLLNDDLRAAMLSNEPEQIELARARLDDHMSLMAKLGVQPADWKDNHKALLRSGRVELPIEEASIWSRT